MIKRTEEKVEEKGYKLFVQRYKLFHYELSPKG